MTALPRQTQDDGHAARQAAMAACSEATCAELAQALEQLAPLPAAEDLRAPETGLVMLRGRMGGDGRPFNLGEATVTRAAVRLATGEAGFAYHLGRDAGRARLAAILDALWQAPARRTAVEAALAPIRARLAAEAGTRARRTAATRVDFFTMVRGES
ncbi:phosphonate C-P lyase system protein PhnG [Chelatococcus sp. SYSU_G07232]|uniref:Phosphonate C-P lyase system protein PhnG n=1 Tax=Chelatococcus albus TaxID=3047466 RepID=A0ABT7AI97_9HYPH|nr:phosphonate C-P lyase system protein PhnG [Chelatococcus sp. SYSU_G07232]MDJ1159106.1 phosphonate C-P lyase system protein PhnG [Chelatococcus sp. SYSU_G07232]